MPRTSGVYALPPGSAASTLTTISSATYNTLISDLETDANTPRPVVAGGTGATTADTALTNLGGGATGKAVFTAATQSAAQDAMGAQLPPGTVAHFRLTTAPSGWLEENGGTIGSASSGATARANADTLNLYTALWTNFDNTLLPIQTSAGAATTRGASASADFAANKRLPLFDSRGDFIRNWDHGRGIDAGRALGSFQSDTVGPHTQTGGTSTSGAHTHTIFDQTGLSGPNTSLNRFAAIGIASNTNGAKGTDAAGDHTHTVTVSTITSGGGAETRPRNVALMCCIKL